MEDFKAIDFGHFQVEEEDVRHWIFRAIAIFAQAKDIGQGLLTIANDKKRIFEAGMAESVFDEQDVIRKVLCEENYDILGESHTIQICSRIHSEGGDIYWGVY